MKKIPLGLAVAASVSGIVLSLAACAPPTPSDASSQGSDEQFVVDEELEVGYYTSAEEVVDAADITDFCGDEPLTIGWAMPVGVTWLLTVDAILKQQLESCPNVTMVTTDAQGDPQKANADINSLVAQGVDGIITDPIFGPSQIPAMKAAFDAGIPIVTIVADAGAKVGTDITAGAPVYQPQNGELWTDFVNRALDGEGTLVFLGGAPGQPSSLANLAAIKDGLEEYPGIELVEEDMQPINNSAAEARRVMSGLLAKHGRIDAVITDNGSVTSPVIDAYEAAGFEPPALAVSAATNGLNCAWAQRKNFDYYTEDGNHMGAVVGLRKLLAAINGLDNPEPSAIAPWTEADTIAGIEPTCDTEASPEIDWSTSLSDEEMKALFQN